MQLKIFVISLLAGLSLAAGCSSAQKSTAASTSASEVHPLTPLSAGEMDEAVALISADSRFVKGSLFPCLWLHEPPKAEVLSYTKGPHRREAFAAVFDRSQSKTSEVVVDLNSKKIVSWNHLQGMQPPITIEELNVVPTIVRKDPRWQEAIKKRGITDFDKVMVDPWAPGTLYPRESSKVRWVRALSYDKRDYKNGYARPIEGIVAVVNMNEQKVEYVIDQGAVPLPTEVSDLNDKAVGPLRVPPKPLIISQPSGPSFELNGNEVRWQKWHFRISVHPREGLVIHNVTYEDQGHERSILYRGSLSEMVVPYGDPSESWTFRNAFDEGEYGIGRLTQTLEVGTEVPENAKFVDATFADDFGKPAVMPRAIAVFERDGALLWKHFEFYNNKSDSRRGRELVVHSIVTVGNYDYGFSWIFRQDGSIELQALLTGIMLAKGVNVAKDSPGHSHAGNWHLVAPYVAAPHHQHFFNFRLDLDVDEPKFNNVSEFNVSSAPMGPNNKANNAFVMSVSQLKNELSARRLLNMNSSRKWIVTNANKTNALGQPTGYALVPGDNSIPYVRPESKVRQRAGFIDYHFWATPYAEDEMHGAGDYPNQAQSVDGLAKWTKQNRSLDKQDVVLWYTFGLTHTPRPEEWPVMTVTPIGFKLLPVSFFSRNPAMDLPESAH